MVSVILTSIIGRWCSESGPVSKSASPSSHGRWESFANALSIVLDNIWEPIALSKTVLLFRLGKVDGIKPG